MNITDLNGVGAKRAHALQSAGIFTVEDLLNYFPRDYDDRSKIKTVAELLPEAVNTIRGVIAYEPESVNLKRYNITRIKIKDHTGVLEIIWFNQPYLKKNFQKGSEYIFTGKVRLNGPNLQMQAPDYEIVGETLLTGGRIVPMYPPQKQYSQKTFRALIYKALNAFDQKNKETLPADILEKYDLADRDTAIRNIHFPESDEMFLTARRRLVFEELFFMQIALLEIKNAVAEQAGILFEETDYAPILDKLPFALTNAQAATLCDIKSDFTSGRRMNRLIQGDVGSGKTAVAFAAAYLAAKNGFQTALMAPTDVLATQHFSHCVQLFAPLGYETVLLTGSIGAKARREALAKISDGTAAIIIGTHALIQKGVTYHRLGLCITDEQHRFGVNQRMRLTQKGETAQFSPFCDIKNQLENPAILEIMALSEFENSIERAEKKAQEYSRDKKQQIFGWHENGEITGVCGFTIHKEKIEITTIAVSENSRNRGIGSAMISALWTKYKLVIEAETDDDAVGFYKKCGFKAVATKKRGGTSRYKCTLTNGGESTSLPHTLVMSATPIPRTLGLILYGDLDISIIGELPPGRQEIKTYCVTSQYRERVNGFILKETEQNRQAYVICPAIEESELNSVTAYTSELSKALPNIKIAQLHGKMKPAEKQEVMDDFKANKIQVIVSTTVIEVGINVPNATLMIVENAERFGLSQLHQLRGRVGRGSLQSYCVLLTDAKNNQTTTRMKAMTQTTDGFKLAELDLEQRGAGDFFGTRQHGLPAFKIANLYRDLDILEQAQEAARNLERGQLCQFYKQIFIPTV
ncbi:MAG: GNAT family N-acetyltransferase [Defluviitaleaceae bacterium]|nr:GNAT family N-acetyltransferase [Defluviitaleaceae bacterium]